MGVRILHDSESGMACLYCSTTDWAFGPVFSDRENADAAERAENFANSLPKDARLYSDAELESAYADFLSKEAAKKVAEDVRL